MPKRPGSLFALGFIVAVTASAIGGCSEAPSAECTTDTRCEELSGPGSTCRMGSCFAALGDCSDADEDGYFVGTRCPTGSVPDCNDNEAAINPGATETCGDGVDNNCVGGMDESCPCLDVTVGSTRDCGRGRCAGVQTCTETGVFGDCIPLVTPEQESCGVDGMGDGVDDDCDGEVDNGCVECGERRDGTGQEIACFDDAGHPAFCSSNGTCL